MKEGNFLVGAYYGCLGALVLWLALAILLALIFSCSLAGYRGTSNFVIAPSVLAQMNLLYSPWLEKAFCVAPSRLYNLLEGGWMSVPMPVCESDSVPFHTHPWWAESFPNFLDTQSWDEYRNLYGIKKFGILFGKDNFRIYERN